MNGDIQKLYPFEQGLIVRDPATRKPLSEKGEKKSLSAHGSYWLRRIKEGSVTTTKPVKTGGKSS